MRIRHFIVATLCVVLFASLAVAQSPSATPEDTATPVPPTSTPTDTATSTPTNTRTPDQREMTPLSAKAAARRKELLEQYDPALKQAGLGEWANDLESEVHRLGASVRQAVVAGINGGTPTALAQPTGVARVHSILAITTSTGAAASKLLLAEGSGADYTVASGVITIRSNQSANTLIITYEPSGS